jgi:hypothetical protein
VHYQGGSGSGRSHIRESLTSRAMYLGAAVAASWNLFPELRVPVWEDGLTYYCPRPVSKCLLPLVATLPLCGARITSFGVE